MNTFDRDYHGLNLLERVQLFLATWKDLSKAGWCDSEDSQEQHRVFAEWWESGRPDPGPFIKRNSNVGPA